MRHFLVLCALMLFLGNEVSGLPNNESVGKESDDNNKLYTLTQKIYEFCEIASNYDSTKVLLDQAEILAKASGSSVDRSRVLMLRGLNEFYSNNFEEAMDIYFMVLEQAEHHKDTLILAQVNLNIGLVFIELGDYEESLDYLQKSLDYAKFIKDSSTIVKVYYNMAIAYMSSNRLDKALTLNEKVEQMSSSLNDTVRILDAINLYGSIAFYKGDFDKSLKYYKEALALYQTIPDKKGVAAAYNNIGGVYIRQHNYSKSLECLKKALVLAKELKMNNLIVYIYGSMVSCYDGLGDCRTALNYSVKFFAVRDSITGANTSKKVSRVQAKYKMKKNAHEIETLKRENQLQLETISLVRQRQIFLLVTIALFIMLMCVTFYLLQKERKLANDLKDKTKELSELNASKDKFFSIIAHDLKNPFNVLVSYTSILKTDLDMFGRDELIQIIDDLNTASESGFNLLQNLLLWTRSQTNRIHILKSSFLLESIVKDVKGLAELNVVEKNQKLIIDVNPDLVVYADKDMISVVLRNLVFNAIKFSPKGSEIHINACQIGQTIKVDVVDSGIGMDSSIVNDLFKVDKNMSRQGTEGEPGTGLGLVLCKEFVEKNGGAISVESQPDEGSVFSFVLPAGKLEL